MVAPEFHIDLPSFYRDPYPDLALMRENTPIAKVPSLGATLITKRDDIFVLEKKVDVFSSDQPDGLMTKLMGQNMMRKDGKDHRDERKAIFPSMSAETVKHVWRHAFERSTKEVISRIKGQREIDIVKDFAMPVSAEALKYVTGLTNMAWQEMDRVSQGMIDGCANYTGDQEVEANCHDCTVSIDAHITERIEQGLDENDLSLLAVQKRGGLSDFQTRANIKLTISGGQNEPRDAIAGITWALLTHRHFLDDLYCQNLTYMQVFEEYGRWISPIGMSPRRVSREFTYNDVRFNVEDRVFFMFGSGNRDEVVFEKADQFNPYRDNTKAITFGAGPHFCAGAWISKCLIAEVALPMLLTSFPAIRLSGNVIFLGWAFRGPLQVPVFLE
ncbi:MAG: cytochrome [Rhodospirillaceae bacterium]|nr:cytochrome [Rhodospirillaceae bacterium]